LNSENPIPSREELEGYLDNLADIFYGQKAYIHLAQPKKKFLRLNIIVRKATGELDDGTTKALIKMLDEVIH
jgi:hypothetical protein